MNEIDAEMRKIEDSLSSYVECKGFIDKISDYMNTKDEATAIEESESDADLKEDEVAEDKGPDFFLTQKEDNKSVVNSEHYSEFDGVSYEKVIGFDKKRLLELFQEIEDKQM
jgi:hypothetical protein